MNEVTCVPRSREEEQSTRSSRRWTHCAACSAVFQRSRSAGSRFERLYTSLLCLLGAASERRRRRQVRSARINLGAWRRQQVLGSRFDAPASRTSSFFFSLSLLLSSLFSLLLVSKAVYYSFKQVSVESFPINFTRLMIFYYFSKNIIRSKFRKFWKGKIVWTGSCTCLSYMYDGLLRRLLVFFAHGRRLHGPLARCPGVPEVPEQIHRWLISRFCLLRAF